LDYYLSARSGKKATWKTAGPKMKLTIPHAQMLCRERDGLETCTKYTDTLLIIWSGTRLNVPQRYYIGDGSEQNQVSGQKTGRFGGRNTGVEHDETYVDI